MEKEKDANKDVEEMMNHISELFLALDDEEVFEEQTYEESHQEENTMSCDPFKDLDDALFMTFKVKSVRGNLGYDRSPRRKARKELCTQNQASCDEEAMEGLV